jgi:hypothetical protein
MCAQEEDLQKSGCLFSLYQSLFRLLGKRQYYPEYQNIDRTLKTNSDDLNNSPSNKSVLKALVGLIETVLKMLFHKIFVVEQWYFIISIDDDFSRAFEKYKPIMPPSDRFWADPHIIHQKDRYYIFVEEYLYHERKGRISVVELDEMGDQLDTYPILEEQYHLSYPSIFIYKDIYYMVPESSENRTIDLYECVEFPRQWQFVMHLMENVTAVDTTLFYYSNKWWLFTAMPDNPEALPKVNLHLFSSEVLQTNTWKPHPQNPIIPDVASPRPAGKIFIQCGKIYRPSQVSSKCYGYGIEINEICRLSENEYLENKVFSIRPNWDKKIKGTHTFSREGRLTVLDVFRQRPRLISGN